MNPRIKRIFKAVNLVLTIALFYFVYHYGKQLVIKTQEAGLTLQPEFLVLSFANFFIFYAIFSYHWYRVCRLVDNNTQKIQTLAFFASQPYKYLPTSLFTLSYRAKYAKQAGLGLKTSSLAQLVENINMIASGGLLALLAFFATKNILVTFLITAVFLAIIFILPSSINLNEKRSKRKISKKEGLILVTIAFSAWIFSGIAMIFLARSIGYTLSPIEAIAANAAAYIAGMLVVFAPGGVGIRELVFSLFSVASPIIVAWRLLTFFADLALGFLGILLINQKTKS